MQNSATEANHAGETCRSTAEASPIFCWAKRIAVTLGLLLAATALLPLLPVDLWWIRIGDFPRLQLLFAYLIGLIALSPFWRSKATQVTGLLLVVGIGIQLYWIFPYLPVAPHEVETARANDTQSRLRILTANVLQKNEQAGPLIKLIADVQPDVVLLCEVNDRWVADLAPLDAQFSYQFKHPLDNTYGLAFYSNLDVVSLELRSMVKDDIPSIDSRIRLRSGHVVRLFAVHPNPPRPGEDTTKRDAELVLVGREVENDNSAIVLGDLNDVGWSRTTNLFQEVSGLLDPRKGRGLYPTYNADSSIWRYPLDYLFHSEDFRVVELRTLPDIGSDHFPLFVELSHEPAAATTQEAPDLDAGDQEDAQDAVDAAKGGNSEGESND